MMEIENITLDAEVIVEYTAAGGDMFDLVESLFLELGKNPEDAFIKATNLLK